MTTSTLPLPHDPLPVIGIACNTKIVAPYTLQATTQLFVDVVHEFGGVSLLIPSTTDKAGIARIMAIVDGIILTGGSTHVAPHHFGANYTEDHRDEARDNLALTLTRECAAQNKPILGVCRGFQEMNVAMGGTLHRRLYESGIYREHQEPEEGDLSVKYAPAHPVTVNDSGLFHQWFPGMDKMAVNSLHWQGVDKVASGLTVEAVAPDGLVEAFSIPLHSFFVGVQWHPEWETSSNPFSSELFTRFMAACTATS